MLKGALHPNLDKYLDAFLGKGDNIPLVYVIMHLCKGDGGENGI